jgi:hypothetical protein
VKLLWHNYLFHSLGNCAMKLCIETGLKGTPNTDFTMEPKSINYPSDV